MTDERVRNREAPFDHPELRIPDGHPGDQDGTVSDGDFDDKQAEDVVRTIAAVGAGGGAPLNGFQFELGLPDGFDGHLEAGPVCSDEGCDGSTKCNRPPPE